MMKSRGMGAVSGAKKDPRKMAAPKDSEKVTARITKRAASPADQTMSLGPATAPGMGAIPGMKRGGKTKGFKSGGSIDGCAERGKTKGRFI